MTVSFHSANIFVVCPGILFQVSFKATTSSKVCHCGAFVSLESQLPSVRHSRITLQIPPSLHLKPTSSQGLENSGLMGKRWHVCQLASDDIHIFFLNQQLFPTVCQNMWQTTRNQYERHDRHFFQIYWPKPNMIITFNGLVQTTPTPAHDYMRDIFCVFKRKI